MLKPPKLSLTRMPTPLEDHGGIIPPAFHTRSLADIRNKVMVFVTPDTSNQQFALSRIWNSLILSQVSAVCIRLPPTMSDILLPNFHPLVHYIDSTQSIHDFVQSQCKHSDTHLFYTEISSHSIVHPEFWRYLQTASPGVNIEFLDETGAPHTLFSATKEGIAQTTQHLAVVAAYSSFEQDPERICDAAEYGVLQNSSRMLQEITVDCTQMFTPLCHLATKCMTDKSPYNLETHRHPYTPIYDMFFRPLRTKPSLKLGEIGVLNGSSILMWKEYFKNVHIDAFDINEDYLKKIAGLTNVNCYRVDAGLSRGLRMSLQEACGSGPKFDILIEDASHRLEHQLTFLRDALDFVAPGGILVIEDIFREIPAARFEEVLQTCSEKVLYAVLITPEHIHRWSPEWENDRLLFVWVR